jgi:HAD superfamily hydrolase (TIGR01484 family)
VKPLSALPAPIARALVGVALDLDDTLLDRGALGEAALGALYALRRSGLRLAVCTGRPASWGALAAAWLPVDLAVAENGAVAFASSRADLLPSRGARPPALPVRVRRLASAVESRRDDLLALARGLVVIAEGTTALADDNPGRESDVTLDVGEHQRTPAEVVARLRAVAVQAGARTSVSSIHLHLTFSNHDKASGTVAALGTLFGEDPTRALSRWAFVGDSGNDAAAFGAFELGFGVANVREHLRALSRPPAYVAESERGAGFAEIAKAIVALRAHRVRDARGPRGPRTSRAGR